MEKCFRANRPLVLFLSLHSSTKHICVIEVVVTQLGVSFLMLRETSRTKIPILYPVGCFFEGALFGVRHAKGNYAILGFLLFL